MEKCDLASGRRTETITDWNGSAASPAYSRLPLHVSKCRHMHVEDGLVRDQPSIPDVDVWGIASVLKSLPIDHIRIRKFLLKPEFHLHCCFGLLDISGLAVSLIATVDQSISS